MSNKSNRWHHRDGGWLECLDTQAVIDRYRHLNDEDNVPDSFKSEMIEEISKSDRLCDKTMFDRLQQCGTVFQVNDWLDELYNRADGLRIWLGGEAGSPFDGTIR